jgi:hypothetical protein
MSDDNHPDDLLPLYVNGNVSQPDRETVDQHLKTCSRCRAEVAQFNAIRNALHDYTKLEPPGDAGLKRLFNDVRHNKRSKMPGFWWRPALATAAVVILVQGALLTHFWVTEPTFETLSGPKIEGDIIQIRFQPTVTESQIRGLLHTIGASIVDGPSALDIYRIRVPQGSAASALHQLQSHPSEIKYAQRE